jgi:DNA-binding LacI/PurR family transcriptional regulator
MDAVKYAQQQNIQVNKDIVFTSYANLPITSYTTYPAIASIEQYPYRQGEKAMEMMIKIIKEDNENLAEHYYFEEVPTSLDKL